MRTAVITILLLAALTACSPPVQVKKNLDGSTNTTIKTDKGEINVNEKGGTTHMKDDSGFEMKSKTESDGSVSYKGKSAEGDNFAMETGKGIDLTEFALKPYPGAESKNENASFRSETKQGVVATLIVVTKDKPADVIKFYEPMITENKTLSTMDNNSLVSGKTSNKSDVFISAKEEAGETTISFTCTIKPVR